MKTFVRPEIARPAFHDAAGAEIRYGRRWEDLAWDGPDETYSVTQHPERFAPLLAFAEALVSHLAAAYDIRLTREDGRILLEPSGTGCAPLLIELTTFPLVRCTAGVGTDIAWFCPCDHCDEDVDVVMDALEREVAAVVDGHLREWLEETREGLYVHHSLESSGSLQSPDEELARSGSSLVGGGRAGRLRTTFEAVPDRWSAWTRRDDS